jgi:hypothetical protein
MEARMTPEIESQTIAQIKRRFAMACTALNSLGWHEGEDGVWVKGQPTPDPDGWIPWSGGECPVDGETHVQFKFRNNSWGFGYEGKANERDWSHDNSGGDIIAYRIHKPEPAPEKPEIKVTTLVDIACPPGGPKGGPLASVAADELRLAADIIEKGLEWEFTDAHGHTHKATKDHDPLKMLAKGYRIRANAEQPLPVPDGWRELRDEEKGGKWIKGAKWANDESSNWEYSPVSLEDDMGAFSHHKNRIIVPIEADPYAELKAAHAAGKAIQFRGSELGEWYDCGPDSGNGPLWLKFYEYRIKPETEPEEWAPLDATDVPVGAIIRPDIMEPQFWCQVLSLQPDRMSYVYRLRVEFVTFTGAFKQESQISRDGGKSWQKCRKIRK